MKRLCTLLVVSLALICLSPMDVLAPPAIPTPNGPGGGFTPIDGGLSCLLVVGVTLAIGKKFRNS